MPKIKKAKPEDAKEISDMFKTVYTDKYSYTRKDEVRKDLENSDMTSFVAVEKNRVVGHGQLRPVENYPFTDKSSMEIGRLGVHKDYQNKGISKQIVDVLNDVALLRNPDFFLSCFNTATDYSQRALKHIGFTPVMLALGATHDYANIGQSNSFLIGMKVNRDELKEQATVYVPAEYRKLAELVYSNLGFQRKIRKKGKSDGDLSDFQSRLERTIASSKEMIEQQSCTGNFITINLTRPAAFEEIRLAEQAGLVVIGLIPLYKRDDGERHDRLIMSYPQGLDSSKVKIYPGLNKKFADLVFDSMER